MNDAKPYIIRKKIPTYNPEIWGEFSNAKIMVVSQQILEVIVIFACEGKFII